VGRIFYDPQKGLFRAVLGFPDKLRTSGRSRAYNADVVGLSFRIRKLKEQFDFRFPPDILGWVVNGHSACLSLLDGSAKDTGVVLGQSFPIKEFVHDPKLDKQSAARTSALAAAFVSNVLQPALAKIWQGGRRVKEELKRHSVEGASR
jgi:hypothetical protein